MAFKTVFCFFCILLIFCYMNDCAVRRPGISGFFLLVPPCGWAAMQDAARNEQLGWECWVVLWHERRCQKKPNTKGPPHPKDAKSFPNQPRTLSQASYVWSVPDWGLSVSQGLFMWDYLITVLNIPIKIYNFHSFRHESYVRVQTAPTTKVLMTSQVNDLPAIGHRWGLLFSLLCGWERTTQSTWVSTGQVKHAQVYFNTLCSQTWNIFHKKWGGPWKDWFTLWKGFKRVAQPVTTHQTGRCVFGFLSSQLDVRRVTTQAWDYY